MKKVFKSNFNYPLYLCKSHVGEDEISFAANWFVTHFPLASLDLTGWYSRSKGKQYWSCCSQICEPLHQLLVERVFRVSTKSTENSPTKQMQKSVGRIALLVSAFCAVLPCSTHNGTDALARIQPQSQKRLAFARAFLGGGGRVADSRGKLWTCPLSSSSLGFAWEFLQGHGTKGGPVFFHRKKGNPSYPLPDTGARWRWERVHFTERTGHCGYEFLTSDEWHQGCAEGFLRPIVEQQLIVSCSRPISQNKVGFMRKVQYPLSVCTGSLTSYTLRSHTLQLTHQDWFLPGTRLQEMVVVGTRLTEQIETFLSTESDSCYSCLLLLSVSSCSGDAFWSDCPADCSFHAVRDFSFLQLWHLVSLFDSCIQTWRQRPTIGNSLETNLVTDRVKHSPDTENQLSWHCFMPINKLTISQLTLEEPIPICISLDLAGTEIRCCWCEGDVFSSNLALRQWLLMTSFHSVGNLLKSERHYQAVAFNWNSFSDSNILCG